MAYKGPVATMREEMERERAAFALTGEKPLEPDSCPIAQKVLRARLFTPFPFVFLSDGKPFRPWRIGMEMVAPKWFWDGTGRALNDDADGLVVVWTRKAHRAWNSQRFATRSIASAILQGEIKDVFWW